MAQKYFSISGIIDSHANFIRAILYDADNMLFYVLFPSCCLHNAISLDWSDWLFCLHVPCLFMLIVLWFKEVDIHTADWSTCFGNVWNWRNFLYIFIWTAFSYSAWNCFWILFSYRVRIILVIACKVIFFTKCCFLENRILSILRVFNVFKMKKVIELWFFFTFCLIILNYSTAIKGWLRLQQRPWPLNHSIFGHDCRLRLIGQIEPYRFSSFCKVIYCIIFIVLAWIGAMFKPSFLISEMIHGRWRLFDYVWVLGLCI